VIGVDSTLAAANSQNVLPILNTQSASDGTYQLIGLQSGHTYKLYFHAEGRNVESLDVDATSSDVPNQDVVMKQSKIKLRLEVAYNEDVTPHEFEIKILNVQNFSDGLVYFHPASQTFDANTATNISGRFTSLADGGLIGSISQNEITTGLIYKLRVIGYPADGGEPVVIEQDFGTTITRNMREDLSKAMLGLDGENEVSDGQNGIEFEPNSIVSGSSTDDPTLSITSEDADTLTNNGSNEPIGDATTFTFDNTNLSDIPVPVCIKFDPSQLTGDDIPDLQLLTYNSNSNSWEEIPGDPQVTIDPLTLTACADINLNDTVAAQVPIAGSSLNGGVRTKAVVGRMSVINTGRKLARNPHALASGGMTLSVGVASSGGVATTAYHQYNFPNPFNLKDKTVTLRSGTSGVGTSVRGTYIVVAPTGSGTASITIRIYNVAGDMVREFKTDATRGQYNYIEWDGKNTSGIDVASGVYFATVDAPGAPKKEPIKMVVVK
jgi:hypothetical protein